ncbi:MAG: hypothetical protein ACP5N7_04535 [Candidatus Pacearchaeota archaeon]
MEEYQHKLPGQVRICYDGLRSPAWYAVVPLEPINPSNGIERKISAEKSKLEVDLEGPSIIKATPKIITALKAKGINANNLRITPSYKK